MMTEPIRIDLTIPDAKDRRIEALERLVQMGLAVAEATRPPSVVADMLVYAAASPQNGPRWATAYRETCAQLDAFIAAAREAVGEKT